MFYFYKPVLFHYMFSPTGIKIWRLPHNYHPLVSDYRFFWANGHYCLLFSTSPQKVRFRPPFAPIHSHILCQSKIPKMKTVSPRRDFRAFPLFCQPQVEQFCKIWGKGKKTSLPPCNSSLTAVFISEKQFNLLGIVLNRRLIFSKCQRFNLN